MTFVPTIIPICHIKQKCIQITCRIWWRSHCFRLCGWLISNCDAYFTRSGGSGRGGRVLNFTSASNSEVFNKFTLASVVRGARCCSDWHAMLINRVRFIFLCSNGQSGLINCLLTPFSIWFYLFIAAFFIHRRANVHGIHKHGTCPCLRKKRD